MKKILLILCALLLTAVGASAQTWTAPQPTASSLTSGNDYYLYNVGADGFLVNGNNYLTQASVGPQGLAATVSETNSGWTVYFTTKFTGQYGDHQNCYLYYTSDGGGKLWCDHDELEETCYFTISDVSDLYDTYIIVSTSASTTYVGWDEEDGGTIVSPAIEEASENTYWQFITPENYNVYIAKLNLYNVLVEAEEMGMTDSDTAYKDAGTVYTSTSATVAEIEAAMVALELAMDVESDNHTGDEVTVNGISYKLLTDNAIPNHSFELGFEGWTNASDFTTEITSSKFELRSDDPQDGDVYLVGTTNSGSSSDGSLGTAWAIEAGKTYYFSYYVKGLGTATDGGYLITSLGDGKGTESVSLNTPTVTSEWQKIEILFTNPGYDYVQVKFRWLNNQWGFDNFQLYEVEPSEDVLDDSEYKTGDEVTVEGKVYEVVSDNMFVNGGFNNSVIGWTAGNGYANALAADAVTITETGGYNDGQYVTINASGASDSKTPTQAIKVEPGKSYLFVGYTSGTTPDSGNLRFSALFEMDWNEDGKFAEKSHTEDGTSYSNTIIQLEWGADPKASTNEWTQTIGIFTVPTEDEESTYGTYSYVGMRMNWSSGSYDGFQLYEIEEVPEAIEWEMTSAGWGTLILPFAASVPSGLTAYSCASLEDDETTLTLTEESTLASCTPYIVKGDADTYSFTGTPENEKDKYQVGLLVGTLADMSQEAGDFSTDGTNYVLQNHTEDGEGLAFYPITSESSDVTLEAYHCYLTLDNSTSPDGVRAFISLPGSNNEETGIVAVESETLANDAIYDLSGRRVAKAVKGVYIQNGKKVLVK